MASKGKRKNKHQAAEVVVVRLPNRVGYSGKCRCGWQSGFVRSVKRTAAKDAEVHIVEKSGSK